MAKKSSKGGQQTSKLTVETITHDDDTRKNIPTAELQPVMHQEDLTPIQVAYKRRNRDLDPQLVWRGKDEQALTDLTVQAPPLYIQEKIHPKVLIDDLVRQTKENKAEKEAQTYDLFSDFNGLPKGVDKTEFYNHDQHWANRMILGDSLQVMASLAEREGLRGKVQCIYFDPPYGIKFNSNFQWSTTTRDVKDGSVEHITREPEQVKAFRDTWRDGIHSYLTYLRERLTVARDLLTETGSIFLQIGEENQHSVRVLMDEIFGSENFVAQISFVKAGALGATGLPRRLDYILWFARSLESSKYRKCLIPKTLENLGSYTSMVDDKYFIRPLSAEEKKDLKIDQRRLCRLVSFTKPGPGAKYDLVFEEGRFKPGNRWWGFPEQSTKRIIRAGRIRRQGNSIASLRYWSDYAVEEVSNIWTDTASGSGMDKTYVVQTNEKVIQRCLLMATDPGDLVLDPTCGSGTTAYVAEQWGRRWITIDTSRVALALARARIMGAKYPYYLLADSREGQLKEAEVSRMPPKSQPVHGSIRQGFVYERVPHITLKSIANNAEIDVIWDKWQLQLEPMREKLNSALKKTWHEWEIPRDVDSKWSDSAKKLHADWWAARIARQQEIDKSIAAKAEFEFLYDKPYIDKQKVRVAGPFTVESVSPHRMLTVGEDDELIDPQNSPTNKQTASATFDQMILENLKVAGVQQAHKKAKISFTSIVPWPGHYVCAEGKYEEEGQSGKTEKRAAIFIGPEFGTVSRPDLVAAAREAADSGFDVLISCAFNYEAHTTEFDKLGRVPVLKARMNADLHMADDLKKTDKANLFVVFGEPDIEIIIPIGGKIQVKIHGIDVFDPTKGEVRSESADGIACWFIDTDYNQESFFARHAYFLGANDPYKSLRSTLKAEINEEVWASLNSDISRPFEKPKSKRIAVKVINHLGDEVMKVYKVD